MLYVHKRNGLLKKTMISGIILISSVIFAGCQGVTQETYDQLEGEYYSLKEVVDQLRLDCENYSSDYDQLKEDYDTLAEEKKSLTAEFKQYQEQMYPIYVQSLQNHETDALAIQAQAYETGITYEQLADSSDKYITQKVKFTGILMGGDIEGEQLRLVLAIDGDKSKLMMISGSTDWAGDDLKLGQTLTVYGTSEGIFDYMNEEQLKIPGVSIEYIEQG